MKIIPAIDLLNENVVRLTQGKYTESKIYSDDPSKVASNWISKGAELIHVVDLDGAKKGEPVNLKTVEEIIKNTNANIQLGGGIRNIDDVNKVLDIGVKRIVLGTSAVTDKTFAENCIKRYGNDKIIFSVDTRNEKVLTEGWELDSGVTLSEMIRNFTDIGLKTMIYTDVVKDGMLKGPNVESIELVLKSTDLEIIAAGGVATIEDIKQLKKLEKKGLWGVIVGKALYEVNFDLEEAIKIAEG